MTQVKDLMTTEVVTINAADPLRDAIRKMTGGRFRRIPVVRDGMLIGIVTDRDIRRALHSPVVIHERSSDEYLLDSVTVGSSMTSGPLTIEPGDDILKAAELMEHHKIGGLPVVENERLVGILTISDLMNYLIRYLREPEDSAG